VRENFRSPTTCMNLWFRSFRVRLSRLGIIREIGKEVGEGFAVFSAKLKHMGSN
jgi:hypothetical protein